MVLMWILIIYIILGVIMVCVTGGLNMYYRNQCDKIDWNEILKSIWNFIVWPYSTIKTLDKILNKEDK